VFKVDVSTINQPLVVQRSALHSNSELNDMVFPATAIYMCRSANKVLMQVFCLLYTVIPRLTSDPANEFFG